MIASLFPAVNDVFTHGLVVTGVGTLSVSSPDEGTRDPKAVSAAFRIAMAAGAGEVEIECWSKRGGLERFRFLELTFEGTTNDGRWFRGRGTGLPGGAFATSKSVASVQCSSLEIGPSGEIGEHETIEWAVPLLGWDFGSETPAQTLDEIDRRRFANLDGSLHGDWVSWTDSNWAGRTLRLRRRSQVAKAFQEIPLVGEICLPTSGAWPSMNQLFGDFATAYDLIAPMSRVIWEPSLAVSQNYRCLLWQKSDPPTATGLCLHSWSLLTWSVNPYLDCVLAAHETLSACERPSPGPRELRALARLVAAPDFPVEQAVLATCAGFELLRSAFWQGRGDYPLLAEGHSRVKKVIRELGAEVVGEGLREEYEQHCAAAAEQLMRRPIRQVVRDMVRDFVGPEVDPMPVGTAVSLRNKIVHEGLLPKGLTVGQANEAIQARRILWLCFLSLVGLEVETHGYVSVLKTSEGTIRHAGL
jgi:hypothetical protein